MPGRGQAPSRQASIASSPRRAIAERVFRRRRFADLVDRQLALFAEEHADLLRDAAEARRRHRGSGAEDAEAELAFGEYQERLGWAAEELVALRDRYAEGLDGDAANVYADTFARRAQRRFPELAWALRDDDEDLLDDEP